MELLMSNQLQMIRRWMMDQGEEDTQDEKGVPRFWLMALNNNDVTSEDNNSSPKGFKIELSFDSNPYFKYTSYHNIAEGDPLLEKSIRSSGDALSQRTE
ncbi:hypothetical protein Bca52824_066475 [Brassica carinata]|uniref:Uncharacterized protein n=1 Tax=Brassica carinata TaxID=52824 RepID=A0A8X7UA41_BRACI|nr:hypothetical protein Bca52824_066475 [Brassica carinata]